MNCMIRKNVLFCMVLTIALPIVTSESSSSGSTGQNVKEVYVFESTATEISNINHDAPKLYAYLQGFFSVARERRDRSLKPSRVFKLLLSKEADTDKRLPLNYKRATEYIWDINEFVGERIDQDFTEHLNTSNNLDATWEWFTEKYLSQCIFTPLDDLKKMLIERDKQKIDQTIGIPKQAPAWADQVD